MADRLPADLVESHDYLLERLSALLEVLSEERQALLGRSPDALHELVTRKEGLCSEIAERQNSLLEALRPATTLPQSMDQLRALAERCRAENAVNGRIANRARQTTKTLLGILTGQADGALYDRPGRERATVAAGHHLGSA